MSRTYSQKSVQVMEGNLFTAIYKMSVPAIIAQLITTIYSIVDTYFVSTLGTNATAAVGVNNSLDRVISLVGMLIGAGACSYIARLLGAKKEDDAHEVMSTSILSGIVFGVIFAVVGLIGITPLVNFLGATDECRVYAIQYATYVLLAAPFATGTYILNMCLRSEGSSTYAMFGMGFGGVLNCFLDPLFIYAFGLGVAGASMATSLSKVVSFIILIAPYIRHKTTTRISLKYIAFKMEHIRAVISIGMASFLRSLFGVIASICINRVAGSFSTSILAAVSVATRVMQFPFAITLGFGQGIQPIIGYNWGAKKYDRVRKCLKIGAEIAIAGGIVMGLVLFAFAVPIIGIFNSSGDASVVQYGALTIRLESLVLFSHAFGVVINMFYAGIGKAGQAMLCSTARQGYCFLPMLVILPWIFGAEGICAVQAAADLLALVVFIPMTLKGYKLIAKEEQKGAAAAE